MSIKIQHKDDTAQDAPKDGRSLGELFGDLGRNTSNLVRQEVQLAKTELVQKAMTLAKGAVFFVVAGVFAFVGFEALVACAILALSNVLSAWLAALIVAGALLVLAGILVMLAIGAIKKEGVAPTETIESLQKNAQWAKEEISDLRK